MVGNLVLAVVLVRNEQFRPLLVVVVAFLLPVVRIVVELSGGSISGIGGGTAAVADRTPKIEITRCTQFLEVEGLSSVHGCLASMYQAGFLSARSPLIFRRSIRVPKIQLRKLCEAISSHRRVTWKLRKSMLGRVCTQGSRGVFTWRVIWPFNQLNDLAQCVLGKEAFYFIRLDVVCGIMGRRTALQLTVPLWSSSCLWSEELHGTVYDGCVATYTLDVICYCKCVFRVFTETV